MSEPRLTVLGAGNALAGDDGVGAALAAALADETLPGCVRVRAAGDPLALLEELEARRQVLLLDACRFGARPGETCFIRLDDPEWPSLAEPLSLHGLDLSTAFRLAGALGLPLDRAWLMGVEPGTIAAGVGLSPELAEAWPRVLEEARRAALNMLDGIAPTDRSAARGDGAAALQGVDA